MARRDQEAPERRITMALRQIMLRMQIDKKKSDLEALRNKDAEFETREKELETAIGEANTEEEQKAVE